MNKKKNKLRLSTKLFVTIMGASLSIGFVLTAVQISIDYYNTQWQLEQLGPDTVQMMRYPALEATQNRDQVMAKRVLEGIFAKPFVSEASIITRDGVILGQLHRPQDSMAYRWLSDRLFGRTRQYTLLLEREDVATAVTAPHPKTGTLGALGALVLTIDAAHAGYQFMARATTTLLAGLLQSAGFGLILYAIIHGMLTRPLGQLIRSIGQIDPRQPGKSVLRAPRGHQNDEIGTWVEQCNHMLEAVAEYSRQRRLAEANVERLTNYDSLTELPNRSLFLKRLETLNQQAHAGDGTTLLYIGLDDFSSVNLLHSYRVGDRVLITLAERLRKHLPEGALLARAGGDQFCVGVTNFNASQARELGEYLLTLARQPFTVGNHSLTLSATIGVAFYPRDAQTPELLLKNAEQVMLLGKSSGGNFVHFYSELADHRLKASKQLEKDLLLAVENNQLNLMFQPQVNLTTGEIEAVEALLRWDHPLRGTISPDEFIAIAESNRAVIPIGLWVLDSACKTLAQWHAQGFSHITLSVNLSTVQLHHPHIIADLERILNHYALPPAALTLEITESSVMEDLEGSIALLQDIHALGVRLAVDDFGTGYSSLSYLRRMPIDEVKLDRSFFIDIGTQANSVKIVEAIVHLGHSLDLQVVAEGTETPAHVDLLQKCRCDRAQGFYYSEPRNADDFLALLRGEIPLRKAANPPPSPLPLITA